ncbi:hypothetical protein QBC47DRAFT_308809 [Echria macrotheca]|uniref:C2H2-type domain-containing protein n=1 Tax=Echria macrotheca TaxID=438768 RepID=A0AAJ0B406_9PEZI|nr:hypothetical protein QBC47DRAFT_308809 [Echria macrotheca]
MAARQASEQALAALQNSQPVDCVFVTDEKIRRRAPKRRAERERKAIREVLFECLHEFFLDGTQPPENAMTILQEGAYQLALRIKRDDSSDDEAFQFCFNLLGFCLEAVKQELRCPGSGAAQAAYDTVDKGKHPCTFPGCRGKSYTRQADLARHMASHQEGDKSYYCDYRKCARKDSPFSRQDHFRDHIRDQHLEDLPVRGKPSDARWWSERNNKPMIERWWRCNKCLTHRVSIDVDGYVCSKCGNACELERQKFRHKWDVTQGRQ